jgi:hypothetical protein
MNIFKKSSFFILVSFALLSFASNAHAVTPTLSISADSSNSSIVNINVTGDPNSGVIFRFYSISSSGSQLRSIGMTNSSGNFSGNISLSDYNIAQNSSVGVLVNSQSSADVSWPYSSNGTATNILTLSQASAVLNVGQSSVITTSNSGSNYLYLSNNSNPQAANIAFSGNQITVTGLSVGQTTANICVLNSSLSSNCASLYVIVQSATSQGLTFSQNNTSIISGQNVQINITGGNGFYQIQNNSNTSIIGTSLNGPALTLYANGTTGSSTITVCSTDMNACGVVKASIGTYTTSGSGLSLSQTYPTVVTGQTVIVNISGGYGTYYISSNSSTNIAQTYLSTSSVTIYGNNPGTDTIIICAPSGQCGTIVVSVVSSSGGALSLSQNNLGIISGQITTVMISGGTAPYSILQNNDGVAQYSLSGSTITITGIKTGSSSATVCSSAGGCIILNVTITSSTSAVSGIQPSFSQNNISINTNQTTAIYMTGNGGYYVSSNSNPNILSVSVSGSSLVISGITVGSANISICQTGGQCNTLYVSVSNATASTVNSVPITFDKSSVSMKVGEGESLKISGGSGVGYYVSYNSNSNSIGVYVIGSTLILSGKSAGSGTISICSSANVCASISVSVTSTQSTVAVITKYLFTKPLKYGMSNNDVTKLQERLKEEGVYSGPITGYYGNLTMAAVKKYQKLNGLDQLGSVGPGTRAALNN